MRASLAGVPTYSQGPIAVNDNRQTPSEGNEILRILGRLEGTVSAIQNDIAEFKAEVKDDRESTSENRRRMHEKIESVRDGLQKTDSTIRVLGALVDKQGKDLEGVQAELGGLKPTVEHTAATVRNWTIRGGLILTALAALGGTLWWALTTYGVALWRYIDQFVPK